DHGAGRGHRGSGAAADLAAVGGDRLVHQPRPGAGDPRALEGDPPRTPHRRGTHRNLRQGQAARDGNDHHSRSPPRPYVGPGTLSGRHVDPRKGRGAALNLEGRFETETREAYDDGWTPDAEQDERGLKTEIIEERAASIITRNQSPDIPFTQSVNPYQGCEHG